MNKARVICCIFTRGCLIILQSLLMRLQLMVDWVRFWSTERLLKNGGFRPPTLLSITLSSSPIKYKQFVSRFIWSSVQILEKKPSVHIPFTLQSILTQRGSSLHTKIHRKKLLYYCIQKKMINCLQKTNKKPETTKNVQLESFEM